MTQTEIACQRLVNQQISSTGFVSAREIVAHLGAMQAQDYAMAKWAIGARLPGATDETIEQAIDNAEIIRTHILRPTWHFVAAADLRWMLALTAPHIRRRLSTYSQQLGLSDEICLKSNNIMAKILEGRQLTREEIMQDLNKAGIPTDPMRAMHLMFSAELEGIACNGPRRGKQHTYALIDERVPPTKPMLKEEALAELARRYFTSHGPATIKDFIWWSGLPAADARAGLEMAKSVLVCEKMDNKEYWFAVANTERAASGAVHFLPAFDEFMVAYTDRGASLDPAFGKATITSNGIFKPIIVVNGKVTGLWKRTVKKDRVMVEPLYFNPAVILDTNVAAAAIKPFGTFLGLRAEYFITLSLNSV